MTHYDLICIGGGPAGSITASLVKKTNPGKSVLILERDQHPRHHVGESSIASWRDTLRKAGLLEKVRNAGFMWKVGTLFHWGSGGDESWTIDFRDYLGQEEELTSWQLDRGKFDELCFRHAGELGADLREGVAATSIRREGSRYLIDTTEGTYSCDFLIDSSGAGRFLARQFGIGNKTWPELNNYAIFGYWTGSKIAQFGDPLKPGQRWTYIGTTRDGWLWHIPIGEDLVSVGLVTDKDSLPKGGKESIESFFLENIELNAIAKDLLVDAQFVQHPLAKEKLNVVRDWTYSSEQTCGDGWLSVGDAAAFVDPIFSTGLLFTAHGSSLAANLVNTWWNDPEVDRALLLQSYDEQYKLMTSTYYSLARVWYSHNLTTQSLHWESKRQILRSGALFEEEADAFNQLLMGSFLSPFDGARTEQDPLFPALVRRESRIYRKHLFAGPADPQTDRIESMDARSARELLMERFLDRWRELLVGPTALAGVKWSVEDRYVTGSELSHWKKMPHLLLTFEGKLFANMSIPLHFPTATLLLDQLNGTKPLREVLREIQNALGKEQDSLFMGAFSLLNFFHEQKWLQVGESTAPALTAMPDPILRAFAAFGVTAPVSAEVNMAAFRCRMEVEGVGKIELTDRAFCERGYKSTRYSHLSYVGSLTPQITELLTAMAQLLGDWENSLSATWWDSFAAGFAGRKFQIPVG